jgi:hypothetical protein
MGVGYHKQAMLVSISTDVSILGMNESATVAFTLQLSSVKLLFVGLGRKLL